MATKIESQHPYSRSIPRYAEVAQHLLANDSPLSRFERECLAAFVSVFNDCKPCAMLHAAVAAELSPTPTTADELIVCLSHVGMMVAGLSPKQMSGPFPTNDRGIGLITVCLHTALEQLVQQPRSITHAEGQEAVLITTSLTVLNRIVQSSRDLPAGSAQEIARVGYLR